MTTPPTPPEWWNPWPDTPPPHGPRHHALGILAVVVAVALLFGTAVGVRVIGRATDSTASSSGVPTGDSTPDNGLGSANVDVRSIANAVSPSVVNISATLSSEAQTAGSGLVLSRSGLVLTNNHVINGATSIAVQVGVTGDTFSAEVVGYDVGDDVALLQLDNASGMKPITLGNPATVTSGDAVVAIGNALGRFNAPSAVGGTVTGLHQSITAGDGAEQESLPDTIRFAGPIRPGDSGGALVDRDGRVIGMNTAADTGTDRFGATAGTTGFAIPITTAIGIADQIRQGDESNGVHVGKRALLGIGLADGSENPPFAGSDAGAEVAQVGADTPADNAGIQEGDTIVRVDQRSIGSNDDLRAALDRHHPGDKVVVRWVDRDGGTHRATVSLAEGPPA